MEATEHSIEDLAASLLAPQPETDEAEEVSQEIAPEEAEEEPVEAEEASADEEQANEEDESEPAQESPEQTYTVKVDGVEQQVTIDELRRGYSGNSYVQKGMQEAAAKRKEADAIAQALQSEREQFLQTVQAVQQRGFTPPPTRPDIAMMDRDPMGYMRANAQYEADAAHYQAEQAQIQQAMQQQQQVTARQQQEFVRQEAEKLKAIIPEFGDPAKIESLRQDLVRAGTEGYGFTADEVSSITDSRAVKVLHDAAQWRALQAGKSAVKEKAKTTQQRTIAPTAKRQEPAQLARKKQLEQAKRSQRPEDFAALLLQRQ